MAASAAGTLAPTVLVAPDSFKGTYPAAAVARAVGEGISAAGAVEVLRPIGDGGEGTLDALLHVLPVDVRRAAVEDPLGRIVEARFALAHDRSLAIVELAEASGLGRVAEAERDPMRASTRGTGQLIAAAVEAGARRVLVTVGGSATTDGGTGALEALAERGVTPDEVVVLCDVTTPWEDAPSVYGPQKGADRDAVRALERRLDALAGRAPRDPRGVPMTGAAGGLAGGLWAHLGATLLSGADEVLDAIGFDALAADASAVVTGEGALDEQTFGGKAVGVVAERCRRLGRPCYAVVGTAGIGAERAAELGLAGVLEATDVPAMRAAGRRIAGILTGEHLS